MIRQFRVTNALDVLDGPQGPGGCAGHVEPQFVKIFLCGLSLFNYTVDTQIQTHQNAFFVRKIPDNLADWFRKSSDQGGNRQDLVALRQLRVLQKIDHLNAVPSG